MGAVVGSELTNPHGDVPCPRSGHLAVVDDDNMYVHGGFDNELAFTDLYMFNLASQKWFHLPTTGESPPSISHAGFREGRAVLVFGGTTEMLGDAISDELFVLDLDRLEWRTVETSGDRPSTPRYGHTFVRRPDTVEAYLFGGTSAREFYNDLYCFNLLDKEWRRIDPLVHSCSGLVPLSEVSKNLGKFCCSHHQSLYPSPRYRHCAVSTESTMYITGGGARTLTPCRDAAYVVVYAYHYDTNVFERLETHPTVAAETNSIDDGVYISDSVGEEGPAVPTQATETVVAQDESESELDVSGGSVGRVGRMPVARIYESATLMDGGMFIIGGFTENEVLEDKDVWRLDLTTLTWRCYRVNVENWKPRGFHTAVAGDGCIVVFGGRVNVDSRTADVATLYVGVPSLKHLCLRTVAALGLDPEKHEEIRAGTPRELVEKMFPVVPCGDEEG